ncbi:MAG: 50S ribosomal protein L31e [Thermoplasmata archaeon]
MPDIEKIFIIPLKDVKKVPRTKRASYAVNYIKAYTAKHMKVEKDKVWIDPGVNTAIWKNGIENVGSQIRVKATKIAEDEIVEVTLPEE